MVMKHLILFVLACFIGFVNLLAQDIHLEVNRSNLEVGESLELKLSYKNNGNLEIKTPDQFQFGGSEQSMMQQSMSSDGRLVLSMIYIRNGYFTEEGTFTLGPAFLQIGKKTIQSNTVEIQVGKKKGGITENRPEDKKRLSSLLKRRNFAGVLDLSKKQIYEGQAVVVNSSVITKMYPDNLSGYKPYSVKGVVESYTLGKGEEIESKQIQLDGRDLLSFSFDKKVMFFNKPGKYVVSPFDITIEYGGLFSQNVRSNQENVEVIPLPKTKPKDFNGVVGSVSIQEDFDGFEAVLDKVNKIKLIVEGYGNIHEAIVPKIILNRGWEEVSKPKFTSKYSFREEGASGFLEYEYFIKCVDKEPSSIGPITISYFDLEKKAFVQLETKPVYRSPLDSSEYLSNAIEKRVLDNSKASENTNSNETKVNNYSSDEQDTEGPFSNPILWITLASMVSMSILVGLMVRPAKIKEKLRSKKTKIKKHNIEENIVSAQHAFKEGNFSLGLQKLEEAIFMSISLKYKMEYKQSKHKDLLDSLKASESTALSSEITSLVEDIQVYRYGSVQQTEEAQRLKIDSERILQQLKA